VQSLVIGGSTGCLGPMQEIAQALPEDFRPPFFAVMHVARDFPSMGARDSRPRAATEVSGPEGSDIRKTCETER
jgi:chemotaxis response regulator CheB